MSTKLEKLSFVIDLLDRVSGPVGKMQRRINMMADASQKAFGKIGTGAAGMAGAGFSLMKFLSPAEDMRQALGEVASLDVGDDVLKGLSDKALQYSIKYGRAADGFVRSAYDIQSAIGGLKGNDLATFTNAGNVLAVATKSDASTITNYMGTMYGIFQKQADKMGKANWVEQLTGQTAVAVKMFKTTGSEMSAAFTSVGANATVAGIGVVEQMAVLGKLQATMSGSEAGTKYKSFLAGVGQAQKKLGLSFVDSEGKLLPMLDILAKIQGKFGDAAKLEDSDLLKQAFGSDEAASMLKLLMQDTTGLANSMNKLGQIKSMKQAQEMAAHMVSPFQRVGRGIMAVTTAIGQGLNPALDPLINGMANVTAEITAWMGKYKNITRWIGYGVLAVTGFVAAMAALTMVTGLTKLGFIGLKGPILAFKAVLLPAKFALSLFTKHALLSKLASLGLWAAMLVGKTVLLGLKGVMLAFQGVMWLVNAAMSANPVGLIVLGIAALIGIVAAAVYWWDDLKKAFLDTSWGQAIMKVIDMILGGLKALTSPIGFVLDNLGGLARSLGFGGDDAAAPTSSPSLDAPRRTNLPKGGVTTRIAQAVTANRTNSRHIGQVVINTDQPMTKEAMEDLLLMGD